jgi:hypothetical protein
MKRYLQASALIVMLAGTVELTRATKVYADSCQGSGDFCQPSQALNCCNNLYCRLPNGSIITDGNFMGTCSE